MQQITIEIITDNGGDILESLLEKDLSNIIKGNRNKTFDDGSKFHLSEEYIPSESFGLYEAIPIVLTFVSGVASQLLASWLYDKLKNSDKHAKITYRSREIPLKDLGDLVQELNRVLKFEDSNGKQKKRAKKS